MPAKRRRTARPDKRLALNKRLVQIRADVATLKRDRASVRRDEFEEMSKSVRELHKNTNDLATQFTRIAQIQAELDLISHALKKAKLLG
jgi:hypothetical protein